MKAIEMALEKDDVADVVAETIAVGVPGSTGRRAGHHREDVSGRRCDGFHRGLRLDPPTATRSSFMSTKQPSMEGLGERTRPSKL